MYLDNNHKYWKSYTFWRLLHLFSVLRRRFNTQKKLNLHSNIGSMSHHTCEQEILNIFIFRTFNN